MKKTPSTPTLTPSLAEFVAWRNGLNDLDRMNFDTLISLPKALEVIAKMPPGQYQSMAICGLALTKALDEYEKNTRKE